MMNIVLYTPSNPEPKTLKAHIGHFTALRSTATTLPPKLSHPQCFPPFPYLPGPPPNPRSTPAFPVQAIPSKSHPPPDRPASGVLLCGTSQGDCKDQNQVPALPLNDFDIAFLDDGITTGFEGSTAIDLTTDLASSGDNIAQDPVELPRRPGDVRHDCRDTLETENNAPPVPRPSLPSITPKPSILSEPLSGGKSKANPVPTFGDHLSASEQAQPQDGAESQELPCGSQERPTVAEIEASPEDEIRDQGSFVSENVNSTPAVPTNERTGGRAARSTGPRQSPIPTRGRHAESTPSVQIMSAVVVPANPRERLETLKRHDCQRAVHGTRQQKTKPRSKSRRCRAPIRTTKPANDQGVESDPETISDPSDDSDDTYTTDSNNGAVKRLSKQRKVSLRPASTISRSQSRAPTAQSNASCRRNVSQDVSLMTSMECSTTPTLTGHALSTVKQATGGKQLSPEDISAVVSAMTEKLLDILRSTPIDSVCAMDQGIPAADTRSVGNEEMPEESRRRNLRWTGEDDKRLLALKSRGWRWWEIKQQFPGRTRSALQQRWSSILRTREMSPPADTRKRKRNSRWSIDPCSIDELEWS